MTNTNPTRHFPYVGPRPPTCECLIQLPIADRHTRSTISHVRRRHGGPISYSGSRSLLHGHFAEALDPQTEMSGKNAGVEAAYRPFHFLASDDVANASEDVRLAGDDGSHLSNQEIWFREKDAISYVVAKPASPKLRYWIASYASLAFALGSVVYAIEVWLRT